jgi:hypothetical protein
MDADAGQWVHMARYGGSTNLEPGVWKECAVARTRKFEGVQLPKRVVVGGWDST